MVLQHDPRWPQHNNPARSPLYFRGALDAAVQGVPLASPTQLTLRDTASSHLIRRRDMSGSAVQSIQSTSSSARPVGTPSWKAEYEKTIWESDNEKLLPCIHATEAALFSSLAGIRQRFHGQRRTSRDERGGGRSVECQTSQTRMARSQTLAAPTAGTRPRRGAYRPAVRN
jgi:hypothetical protein